MKFPEIGIGVIDDAFVKSEELIHLIDSSEGWRSGTAGGKINENVRVSDVYELLQGKSKEEDDIIEEIIDTFMSALSLYAKQYPGLNVSQGENLRVMRYNEGGFYNEHIDAIKNSRTLSGILYLNGDFEGGNTVFLQQALSIEPREGRLVLFPSNFMYPHKSEVITKGTKYAIVVWFS